MEEKRDVTRRGFIAGSAKAAAGATALSTLKPERVLGANDTINIGVIGIRGRGSNHYQEWANKENVRVTYLCDVDERLFPQHVKRLEELQGFKPKTIVDMRKLLEDKDIDAVSIATTDHWHALSAIWACQAGKHVYLEKPTSHNIWEGGKIVEAARKYNRIVAAGTQNRSLMAVNEAMKFLHDGGIGKVYMAKGLCFKPRDSIGTKQDAPIPEGVHYDLWLGPAPWRPFNPNRFHYNWHWFWDYGCTDMGNQGPHQMDIARWGLGKDEYPKKIKCVGGYYAFDSDQETPNTQFATFEYADGVILQFETRGLYTNADDGILIGNLFFGTEGWMHLNGTTWKTYYGRKNEPGPSSDSSKQEEAADPNNLLGTGGSSHFQNFIYALRANDWMKLNADILEGQRSTNLCHLGNISYRLGRELEFDSHSEKFVGDDIANSYLTRNYRHPYVVPDKV